MQIKSRATIYNKKKILEQPCNIICDFDGTISLADVTDSLLTKFASPEWKVIEQKWQDGLIGSRQCLAEQIPLLDMSKTELDNHLDQIEIDPDFSRFVAEIQAQGHQITIVSDGLDYSIKHIFKHHSLDFLTIKANQLVQEDKRRWSVTFPNSDVNCKISSGNCKCTMVELDRSNNIMLPNSVLIGDGTSDFCVASNVGLVLAKKALIQHCIENEIPHFSIENFSQARSLLAKIHVSELGDIS